MKIALIQQNYHIGNFNSNILKVGEAVARAKQAGANLVVTSELSVCGHFPFDLLDRKKFIFDCNQAATQLKEASEGITMVVGTPSSQNENSQLHNSAYVFSNGTLTMQADKATLDNRSMFNELRHFTPGSGPKVATIAGVKVAIAVGGDINMHQQIKDTDAQLIINCTATPFAHNNTTYIDDARNAAKTLSTPVILVNQVGANTDLIYEGASMVINAKGETTVQLASFEEDFAIISLDDITKSAPIQIENKKIAKIHDALVCGIKDYFAKSGLRSATLGLSGGIDSAIVLALAEKALGADRVKVLLLPSKHSSSHSITDAVKLAQNLNIEYEIVPIKEITNSIEETLAPLFENTKADVTEENIQARTRGLLLMAFSNKFGHILLNTSNKSEAAVGYGTLYGDMCGGLAVIADVYKTEIYELAHYINRDKEIIPNHTITKVPSAELRPDQKDSDSLPDYKILDDILYRYIELNQSADDIINAGHDADTVNRAIKLVNINEHKRFQAAPALRVSSTHFGTGRTLPIVAKQ